MKKRALVNLKGGLGNQIFQLSFANYLRSLDFKVFIDTTFYEQNHPFPRNLEIIIQDTGFREVKIKSNILFQLNKSLYVEDDTFEIKNLKTFNRFIGYYQNLKYLEDSKNFLKTNMNLNSNNFYSENIAAIHIRKTDYSNINQELTETYYMKAIDILLKIDKSIKFDVYSDDPKLKLDSKIFKNINNLFLPTINEKPINVLRKMLNYKNYVIANSSFSAIAAYLSEFDNKVVIYPSPWWRNSDIKLLNIPSNWIRVANN